METYSLLREIADSWVLLAMFTFFICAAILAFLPSQRKAREDASMIPFRNELSPASDVGTGDNAAVSPKVKGQIDV